MKVAPFDRNLYLANAGVLEDFAKETVLSFLETLPKLTTDIEMAITSKNASELEFAAHSLKGAISHFYAEPSRLLCWKLEQMGHGKDFDGMKKTFCDLKMELDRLVQALKEFANERNAA